MAATVGVINGSIRRIKADGTSGYFHEYHLSGNAFTQIGPPITYVPADSNTTGGENLDVATQFLEYTTDTHEDWDETSDPTLEIIFEVNVNNAGGLVTDTVDIDVVFTMKGEGEIPTKQQSVTASVVVGQSPQYKQFRVSVALDHDDVGDPLDVGDIVAITLNLNTVASEVDDIIFNAANYLYETQVPAEER